MFYKLVNNGFTFDKFDKCVIRNRDYIELFHAFIENPSEIKQTRDSSDSLILEAKTEVPIRDVRNSKVRKQDKFRRHWSQH